MKKAFSLIELSIALSIVAALILGVMQAASMVRASRISNAKFLTINSPVTKISGLVAWYETSLPESLKGGEFYQGAQISEWRDINPSSLKDSKNRLTKTASSSVTYQAEAINDLPSLKFAGTGKLSLNSFFQGAISTSTIFIVLSPLSISSTTACLVDNITASTNYKIGIRTNTVILDAGSSVSTGTSTNAARFAIGSNYVMAVNFNATSSGVYINNPANLIGNANLNPGTSNPLTGLVVGSEDNDTCPYTGLISEIIIYNRPLNLGDRRDVMDYLAKKYNITVTGL